MSTEHKVRAGLYARSGLNQPYWFNQVPSPQRRPATMDLQQLCLLPWLYIGCTALCPSPDVSPRLYLCIPLVRFPSILPSSFVFMRSLYCLMWPQCNDRQFVLGHTDVIAHERVDNLPGKASKIVTKDQPLDGATSWTHLQNRRKDNFH